MSFFLFEKQQINCACFESSPQNVRRIFRSESQHYASNNQKSLNGTPVKFQTPKTKLKKKSLKKQQPTDPFLSPNVPPQSHQIVQEKNLPEINSKNVKKQQKPSGFEVFQVVKPQRVQTERSKATHNLNMIGFPPSFPSQQFMIPTIGKSHNKSYSHHLIPQNHNEQYEKRVQQEFKKDLNNYRLNMEVIQLDKNPGYQKAKNSQQKHSNLIPNPSISILKCDFQQFNLLKNEEISSKQIFSSQKLSTNKKDTKEQYISAKKHPLDRMDSLQLIPQQKILQNSLLDLTQTPVQRQRKNSFRNSTILYKEKQLQARKIKQKMYAKEIESQKDGSSENLSDKMSEVVGRGWDGLTEQKQEQEELDDLLIRKESKHSQTMITQESHIRNSEIKTFTDFSNSFISPKSHKTRAMQTSTAFGVGKYGMASISYQNIEDLHRLKSSISGKLHF